MCGTLSWGWGGCWGGERGVQVCPAQDRKGEGGEGKQHRDAWGCGAQGSQCPEFSLQGSIQTDQKGKVACLSGHFLTFWGRGGTDSTNWIMCLLHAHGQAQMQREEVCMYVYVYVCVFTYVYAYVYTCIRVYLCCVHVHV